jgi:hypothetical protein
MKEKFAPFRGFSYPLETVENALIGCFYASLILDWKGCCAARST